MRANVAMATRTPSPPASRPRTPPTPLHGPKSDHYNPYSPRRSKRVNAQSYPTIASQNERTFHLDRQREITPPSTIKKARFARSGLSHLSSPPPSPASPIRLQQLQKTPRRVIASASRTNLASDLLSDGDNILRNHTMESINMLPTPSKTPKKRFVPFPATTARIIHFQPDRPNDVMPTPRKARKFTHSNGFDLYDAQEDRTTPEIEIFTDTNARVPEVDNTHDNPFVGPRRTPRRVPQKSSRLQQQATNESERMDEAVRDGEGVTYVFRGKKVFRRFQDSGDEANSQTSGSDLGKSHEQRMLKRQAGDTAHRPLTRSMLKPRLLFPTKEENPAHEAEADEIDEEALTDIDVSTFKLAKTSRSRNKDLAPFRVHFAQDATPPLRDEVTFAGETNAEDDLTTPTAAATEPESVLLSRPLSNRSPFDEWPRTKSGRKRSNESPAPTPSRGKRSRGINLD